MLVLILTLSLAGVAMSAVFLSQSAALLGRYHDRDRDYRLAADMAADLVRNRWEMDTTFAVPDTGVRRVWTDTTFTGADGVAVQSAQVSAWVGMTGDTTGNWNRRVTIITLVRDQTGVRAARRLDLLPQSFGRNGLVVHDWPSGTVLQGEDFQRGRVWSNGAVRASSATEFYDSVFTVSGVTGAPQLYAGSATVSAAPFPDTTWFGTGQFHGGVGALATAGNLRLTPVSGTSGAATRGTRLEYLTIDANNNGAVDADEGFLRVFDLAAGMDTTRLKGQIAPPVQSTGMSDAVTGFSLAADRVSAGVDTLDVVLQNQCGAFYTVGGQREFFTIAAHRQNWVLARIRGATSPTVSDADTTRWRQQGSVTDREAIRRILSKRGGQCFPAGSPFLVTSERFTNSAGTITGTAADTVPWGIASASHRYGGTDTTFSLRSRTCTFDPGTTGRCVAGTHADLGSWRTFPGTALSGVPSSVRQAVELPYLWPFAPARNAGSRGVVRIDGRAFLSGTVRGAVTTYVDGTAVLIDDLVYTRTPADTASACADLLGLIARDSVMVGRTAMNFPQFLSYIGNYKDEGTYFLGGDRDVRLHAWVAALNGILGNEGRTYRESVWSPYTCPLKSTSNSYDADNRSAGCLFHVGPSVQRSIQLPYVAGSAATGLRVSRMVDACQRTTRRPPWFPQMRRTAWSRLTRVEVTRVDTQAEVVAFFAALRGNRDIP